jgi:protein TonB
MSTKARAIAIISSMFLSVLSGHALAADRSAKIDESACRTPAYPVQWQADDQQGAVLLSVLVKEDGSVGEAKVLESSGYARIDKASLRAGINCKFKPGTKNGEAAPSWVKMQYSWVLN